MALSLCADFGALEINLEKTAVYSPDKNLAASVAAHLQVKHEENGLQIVGGFVSADGSWVEQQLLTKCDELQITLDKLDDVPAPIAFPILQTCVNTRWVYIARTHHPSAAMKAHIKFDEMIRNAFVKIAGFTGELPMSSRMALHLPVRDGGLGVTCYEHIGTLAYQASVNEDVGGSQFQRASEFNARVYGYLSDNMDDGAWEPWLRASKKNGASLWLRACCTTDSKSYGAALLARIRAYHQPATPTTACPHCGNRQSPQLMISHILGCARQTGIGPTTRHTSIVTLIVNAARDAGHTVHRELTVSKIMKRNVHGGDRRMDAVITDERRTTFVDVHCPSTTSKSYQLGAADKEKQKLYLSAATEAGAILEVFTVDALGGFSTTAEKVCRMITTTPEELQSLRTRISWAIWTSNGAMFEKWTRFLPRPALPPTANPYLLAARAETAT
jgi:hypothetical protein